MGTVRRILLSMVVAALAVVAPAVGAAAQDDAVAERLVALANQERSDRGIPAFTVSTELTSTSCAWNRQIMANRQLSHDPDLQAHVAAVIPNLRRWAENLGTGPKADGIHSEWMASSSHAPHILDPQLQLIGVCADRDTDGQIWVTQRFATAGAAPAATQPTTPRTTAPRTTKPPATKAPAPATPTTAPPTVPPTTPAAAEPPTTAVEPTSTTTAATPDTTSPPPLVALELQHAGSSSGGLSPVVVVGVVLLALVLMSSGALVIARSRRAADEP
jgi:hypothetical protein